MRIVCLFYIGNEQYDLNMMQRFHHITVATVSKLTLVACVIYMYMCTRRHCG